MKLTEHKSNDFGSGLLDALAAVNAVLTGDGLSENALNVSIFPNPTRDKVTVQCEGMRQIEVYAMDGRLVKCLVVSGSECLIEGLSSGVYLVKIETNKETITKKIVKM